MDEGMMFFYDEQGDILDISISEPKEAISEETGDDILIRRDVNSNEIVGFTILNFEKRFRTTPKKQSVPVKVKFVV